MNFLELFLLAIGLSMDAFAVSICKGLSLKKVKVSHILIAGAWFGIFQAMMPVIGFLLGKFFNDLISHYSHWIAFFLLAIIGCNMIKEATTQVENDDELTNSMDFKTMFLLAVATSIDALAVGVSFAVLKVNLLFAVLLIGCTTFILSGIGVKVGSIFGDRFEKKAQITGGLILVLLGIKILIEGLLG